MAKPNAKTFTCRFTTFHRRITPKPAYWWWTRNARHESLWGGRNQGGPLLPRLWQTRLCAVLTRSARRVRVATNHGPVNEVADTDRERNDAERGDCPNVTVRLNAGDQSKSSDVRSEEHTSELQSHLNLVCRLLLEKKKQ